MRTRSDVRHRLDTVLLLMVLPLAGLAAAGAPILRYLEFPPLTRYVPHAGFSWPAFLALAAATLLVVLPFVFRVLRVGRTPDSPSAAPRLAPRAFPWWGWVGAALAAAAWFLAWTRFGWLAPLQRFTFTPIWLGYILVVNALTFRRTGHCLLRDRPRRLLALFVTSAAFWWYFEYLNRFVQNWYYVGVDGLSRTEYFLFATLPFSTVLPAVLSTCELLTSFLRLSAGLDGFLPLRVRRPRAAAWAALALSCGGLAAVGVWPDYLFPLLWLAPLLVITSLQAVRGQRTILSPLAQGDWRRVALLALSALVCGFFWELWNVRSLAKWVYAVPFVGRFRLFEMPLLGYAGYLPFGLECAVVADFFLGAPTHAGPAAADRGRPIRPRSRWAPPLCGAKAAALAAIAVGFFLVPGLIVVRELADPALRNGNVPRLAWRLHRSLTPRYERWARRRVASGRARSLALRDVPSTEWPMFGSVYYLWATEALQRAWEEDPRPSRRAPRDYARDTIEAATALVLDPAHHSWVKTHWGENYLHRENVFFRTLIIAALTSRQNLLGDGRHLALLRDQVDSLAAELDASPFGVLEDYPGECYPVDVLATIACIRRADRVLGTDHSAFAARAVRAFEGDRLDARGLVPYFMDADTGAPLGPSRGVGNSYILIFAPELWPDRAADWYARYEACFWQRRGWATGFREFPSDLPGHEWLYDVDAGPVIAGFSPAANAFGVAAAKVNGRLDHAYTLSAQVLAASWPLPGGALLGPRLLSDPRHAPYLGEACLLYLLAQRPAPGVALRTGGHTPAFTVFGCVFYFGGGLLLLAAALGSVQRARRLRRDQQEGRTDHE